ncbi:hypothetical protein KAU11_03855 [Candidatus Babeliales bacterium]|nr:hypothetical protein [Candidatus Babeliales bacterium]
MKLIGLIPHLEALFNSKPTTIPWGMKTKHHLPKPRAATPERKKRQQMVQASRRKNRRND